MTDPEAPTSKSDQQLQNEALLGRAENAEVLLDGYGAALRLHPGLSEMKIIPIEGDAQRVAFARATWMQGNMSGKHEIHVRLQNLAAAYEHMALLMAHIPAAFDLVAKRLGIPLQDVTPELMHTYATFHEMGHVAEYMDHQDDPMAFRAAQKAEKLSLPIANVATSALVNPQSKTRAYIDQNWQQISQQFGVSTLDELIHLQATAYRNMPSEVTADDFATKVFEASALLKRKFLQAPSDL